MFYYEGTYAQAKYIKLFDNFHHAEDEREKDMKRGAKPSNIYEKDRITYYHVVTEKNKLK